jgi:hypothetical protein
MTPMSDAERQRQTDDAFRAVGRYVVEFSALVGGMRRILEQRISRAGDLSPAVPELLLGEAPASQIAVAFFGVCRYMAKYDAVERKIESKLRNEVKATIEKRNDVAHGDWWVGLGAYDADSIDPPVLVRIRPLRDDFGKVQELAASDLDAQTDAIVRLINQLEEFGRLSLGLPVMRADGFEPPGSTSSVSVAEYRIEDIFVLKDGQVAREGPKARELAFIHYHPG